MTDVEWLIAAAKCAEKLSESDWKWCRFEPPNTGIIVIFAYAAEAPIAGYVDGSIKALEVRQITDASSAGIDTIFYETEKSKCQ